MVYNFSLILPQLLLKSFKKENILEVDISNKLLEKSFSDSHFPKKILFASMIAL